MLIAKFGVTSMARRSSSRVERRYRPVRGPRCGRWWPTILII